MLAHPVVHDLHGPMATGQASLEALTELRYSDVKRKTSNLIILNLGVLTSLCRIKRSLLPLLSISPFQANAPTLEKREVNSILQGLRGRTRKGSMICHLALWPDRTLTRLAAATSQIWTSGIEGECEYFNLILAPDILKGAPWNNFQQSPGHNPCECRLPQSCPALPMRLT